MRLVTFSVGEEAVAGVLSDGGIVPLSHFGHDSVLELLGAGADAWRRVAVELGDHEPVLDVGSATLLAPIPVPPRNVFCVGLNYYAHAEEGGAGRAADSERAPIFFTKPWTSLVGNKATVTVDPSVSVAVDWEAELAVVIGTGGINIRLDDASSHVFGATLANDVSARDLQLANGDRSQWFKGKALDGFCPLGPALVSVDELPPLDALHLQLTLGDELMQSLDTSLMIHSIPKIISYLSRGMRLLPGDVILTGTGAGVGHWRTPPRYLTAGDVTTVSCDVLGELRTSFATPGT